MSDIGEMFSVLHEINREKRQQNTARSTSVLTRENILFVSYNGGVHLLVAGRWDFWPATGLFIDRTNQKRGRGVFNLIRVVRHA